MDEKKINASELDINDYEMCLLIAEMEHNKNLTETDSIKVFEYYIKVIIKYVSRLLFAIGWDKLRPYVRHPEIEEVYNKLFRDPDKAGKDEAEPGGLRHLLLNSSRAVNKTSLVKKEISLLDILRSVRNPDAHELRITTEKLYNGTLQALKAFGDAFGNKVMKYIIPYDTQAQTGEIMCCSFEKNKLYANKICLPKDEFEWIPHEKYLFYQVTDMTTLEKSYYCLNPFIEGPRYCGGMNQHFRIYKEVQNGGYGCEYATLKYITTAPKNFIKPEGKNYPEADIEETSVQFRRSALFPAGSANRTRNGLWNRRTNDKRSVYINISSYPGYGDVQRDFVQYCEDICPAKADVIGFCKDRAKQSARIVGNGGLGKTALMLHLINLFITKPEYMNLYTNIIFLSAKKKYYDFHTRSSQSESRADIKSYEDLIKKIAGLLEAGLSGSIPDIADSIVNMINSEEKKRFLLIIDDLDSLPTKDQESINNFILRFEASKLKSIVTTRDILRKGALDYSLSELSPEKSILYAKWYVTHKMSSVGSWENWSARNTAERFITDFGDGNPLTIQMLLLWTKTGDVEINTQAKKTRNERISYMYSTVQNLMSAEAKKVFEICRQLYLPLDDESKSRNMPVSILEYLSAGIDIQDNRFRNILDELHKLRLISVTSDRIYFIPYNLFILSETIVPLENVQIPGMYRLFWRSVKDDKEKWFQPNKTAKNIADCIYCGESDPEFDNVTARRIFEYMSDNLSPRAPEKEKIGEWLSRHSGGTSDTSTRLIQEIEGEVKNLDILYNQDPFSYDEFSRKETEIHTLIRELSGLLRKYPDDNIAMRLKNVQEKLKRF